MDSNKKAHKYEMKLSNFYNKHSYVLLLFICFVPKVLHDMCVVAQSGGQN